MKISEFSKVIEYKVNIKKSFVFLHASYNPLEIKLKEQLYSQQH